MTSFLTILTNFVFENDSDAVTGKWSVKNMFLKIYLNLIELQTLGLLLKKKTPTQVFSGEFCERFYKQFFYRTPPKAASYN